MKNLHPYAGKFRALLLFGPPGSGKGTQGKLLSQIGGHVHISTGDIFRGLDPKSPAGQLIHGFTSKGHLVPDDVTIGIFLSYIQGLIATNRYFPEKQLLILDGIPRTIAQAKLLENSLDILKIAYLEIRNVDAAFDRMALRAKIEKRQDDLNRDIFKTRMQIYENETIPLMQHYKSSLLLRIDAERKIPLVLAELLQGLSSIL